MAEQIDPKAEASAEKAYAAAAEALVTEAEPAAAIPEPAPADMLEPAVTPEPAAETPAPPPVEFPAKAKRAAKPAAPKPDKPAEPEAKAPALPKARKPATKPAPKARVVAKPARKTAAKPAVAKIKPAGANTKPAVAKAKPAALKVAAKSVKPKAPAKSSSAPQLKEKTMEKAAEFTEGMKKAAADAQAKAKQAYDKGSAVFGEYAEFAKGNVEAIVASGKILATGVQKMGSEMVTEGKTAFETATADVKQLAKVKSPSEFLKLNTDILRRNFDSAIKLTTKNGETMMKLASESFAPISGRFTLALDKFKKAA